MPRESYNVRVLRTKALSSFRRGVTAFNGLDNDGRVTVVLLSFQHAFEMLLKSILDGKKTRVFDKKNERSISLESAIRLCQQLDGVKLSDEEAGTIRVLDSLRDAEQHWHVVVDEGLLYLNVRAAVTLFDELLMRAFAERISDHIPARVLPISAEPPQSLDLLVDREFERVAELLKPGRRASAEAMARISLDLSRLAGGVVVAGCGRRAGLSLPFGCDSFSEGAPVGGDSRVPVVVSACRDGF